MILATLLLLLQVTPAVGVKVSGRVIDGSTGKPSVGTVVTLWQKTPRQTKTTANGEFEFAGLSSGFYELRAERAPTMSMPTVIEVKDRDLANLGLVLGIPGASGMPSTPVNTDGRFLIHFPTVGIPGNLVLEGGGALPKGERPISFSLTDSAGMTTRLLPDLSKEGMFRLGILEGDYKFAVGDVPRGYVVKSMTYGKANLQSEPLKVTGFPLGSLTVTLALQK